MDFVVPITCYNCGNDFNVFDCNPMSKLLLPLHDEGGYTQKAICPKCKNDCGEIRIILIIK